MVLENFKYTYLSDICPVWVEQSTVTAKMLTEKYCLQVLTNLGGGGGGGGSSAVVACKGPH